MSQITMALSENELIAVLRNSLYPGAQDESIKMVIGYCKAANLDPIQKPVHIVPMWCSKSKQMRDVIMPGIGSYRTQAARSGCYAGISEPEFGPDISEDVGGVAMTYPAWCRVIVKRLLENGAVAEFSAKELWKENYATAGKDSAAPNAMWKKRPYAQLSKCAEAQALRKAFPEYGAQPTADEMEGKSFEEDGALIDGRTGEIINKLPEAKVLPDYTDEQFKANINKWIEAISAGKTTSEQIIKKVSSAYTLSDDQIKCIQIYDKESS